MASQRVLLLAIGGVLADDVWRRVCGWADARTTRVTDTWSGDDWPAVVRDEIDAFIEAVRSSGFTPPILYRCEYADCWSMGDVYQRALVKPDSTVCRQLCTMSNEVIARWVRCTERVKPRRDAAPETIWLYNRLNEAAAAWAEMAERRLIVLVRSTFGGLWTDDEVIASLDETPDWWGDAH